MRRATSNFSPRNPYKHIKRSKGKRSGLEVQIDNQLALAYASRLGRGFKGEKEIKAIEYQQLRPRKYHPDFQLHNGIIIEAKGWFKSADRSKHLAIKIQYPHLDIRFVFSNPNAKIGKKSSTTYAMWCERNGFKFAKGVVPESWINEPGPT